MALVVVETPQDGVALVRLNRPEARNALSVPLRRELAEAFTALAGDDSVRVAILTGDARAFAAGADLAEMAEMDVLGAMARPVASLSAPIEKFPKPLIAAIEGFCLGGGLEIALACDLRIASQDATFGLPETGLGLIPGGGGTQRLPRLIGLGRALDMMMTGDRIDAPEALRIGLITRLSADHAALESDSLALAARIAARPPVATAFAKEAAAVGIQLDLPSGLRLERALFTMLLSGEERREAVAAFREKRKPDFNSPRG